MSKAKQELSSPASPENQPSVPATEAKPAASVSAESERKEQKQRALELERQQERQQRETKLCEAADAGEIATVRSLLQQGVGTSGLNEALHAAAAGDHSAIVTVLLDKGAEIDAEFSGQTALHKAAARGHTGTIAILLDRGAKIDAPQRVTPLHLAVRDGNVGSIEMLLDRGAKIDAQDGNFATPLHYAAGSRIKIAFAVKGEAMDAYEIAGEARGDTRYAKVINLLLDRGAKVNARDDRNYTALFYAAASYRMVCVQALLDRSADPTLKAIPGGTAASCCPDEAIRNYIERAQQEWPQRERALAVVRRELERQEGGPGGNEPVFQGIGKIGILREVMELLGRDIVPAEIKPPAPAARMEAEDKEQKQASVRSDHQSAAPPIASPAAGAEPQSLAELMRIERERNGMNGNGGKKEGKASQSDAAKGVENGVKSLDKGPN